MLTCFISYCHDDNAREVSFFIGELIKKIESKTSSIDIYFDVSKNKIGDIISENENKILNYDVVVPFFTPKYKDKTINASNDDTPKESGVRREYRKMLKRKETDQLCFVPILLSGSFDESVPAGFEQILYKSCEPDSNWARYDKVQSRYMLTDEGKLCVNEIAQRIIDKAIVNNDKKRFVTKDIIEQAEKTLLLDSNNTNAEAIRIPWECLVQLEVYKKVQNAQAAALVGRKGSGKTTFLDTLTTTRELQGYNHIFYKRASVISSKNIPEDSLYIFTQKVQKCSDKELFSIADICDIFWETVYGLQCVFSLWLEYSYNHGAFDGDNRKNTFKTSIKKLCEAVTGKKNIDQITPDNDIQKGTLQLACDIIEQYWESEIIPPEGSNASIYSYAVSSFNASKILKKFFGVKLYESLYRALKQCNKKILIAIDAFDSYISEMFIPSSLTEEEKNIRQTFDSIFYKEAIITAESARKLNYTGNNTYLTCCARFCILIPEDKFALITLIDRDATKRNIIPLYWDAESLMEMLVKRLEYVYKRKTGVDITEKFDKKTTIFDKFDELLSFLYPNIPTQIQINLSGTARTSIHLFNYLLRNSFWRPRDILCLFANVVACDGVYMSSYSDEKKQLMIKDAVYDCVKNRIISKEFLGEYKETYDNLSNYLKDSFKKCDLIMDIDEFMSILSRNTNLGYHNAKIKELSPNDKLEALYRMGVIGFYISEEDIHHFAYGNRSCFFFNEGIEPLNEFLKDSFSEAIRDVKIIFNPILIKHLSLNTQYTTDLICDYNQSYIINNHRRYVQGNICH